MVIHLRLRRVGICIALFLVATGFRIVDSAPSLWAQSSPLTQSQMEAELKKAGELRAQAIKLHQQKELNPAIAKMQQSVSAARKVLGEKDENLATLLNDLGQLQIEAGDFKSAKTNLEQSLKIRQSKLGPDHPETISLLNSLGSVLKWMGDYPAAKPYFEKALSIAKKSKGSDHPDTGATINNLADLLHEMGDSKGAKASYEQALVIAKKSFGTEHPNTASVMSNLANCLQDLDDFENALKMSQESLRIRRKTLGEKDPTVATGYDNLSSIQRSMGNVKDAIASSQQAVAVFRATLGSEHPETATSIANQGSLYRDIGDYAEARRLMEEALSIRKKSLGVDHPNTAASLDLLASVLSDAGEYKTAREYYEQALAIRRKKLGDEHPSTAVSMLNVSKFLSSIGEDVAAGDLVQRALEIQRKVLGNKHSQTAQTLGVLAAIRQGEGKLQEAQKYAEEGLAIQVAVFGSDHQLVSSAQNNLGLILASRGKLKEAETQLERALASRRKTLGDDHADTATVYFNLALVQSTLDDRKSSEKNFQSALRICEQMYGSSHLRTASIQFALAALAVRFDDEKNALLYFHESRKTISQASFQWLQALSRAEQLRFLFSQDSEQFSQAISWAIEHAEQDQVVSQSAEWVLNQKGMAHEILSIDPRMALTDSDAKKRATKVRKWVEVDSVRSKLPSKSLLVEFQKFVPFNPKAAPQESPWGKPHYAAWMIPSLGRGSVRVIDLGESFPIDQLVEKAQSHLTKAGGKEGIVATEGEASALNLWNDIAGELGKLIYDPMASHLNEIDQIILSPDSQLWLVPWSALPINDGPINDSKEFLVERYATKYMISGRHLALSESPSVPTSAPAIFSNPKFDLPPKSIWEAIQAVLRTKAPSESNRARSSSISINKSSLRSIQPLPGTAIEAALIAPNIQAYTKVQPLLYSDQFALESVAKSLISPRVVGFATHGFFRNDQIVNPERPTRERFEANDVSKTIKDKEGEFIENPLDRCGLLLAGAGHPNSGIGTAGDDGVLTGLEIAAINLRGTELVVLSACETGIGEIQIGDGVAGLRQAFQLAGAKSVVSTLWSIPDRDSALVVAGLFDRISKGDSVAEGLRSAQLERIKIRRERFGGAHPFFWAAFTVTGN